jgi:tetratricopeptide (TPR) repeat protein/DNA-binding CsgD family transcriptional regulator
MTKQTIQQSTSKSVEQSESVADFYLGKVKQANYHRKRGEYLLARTLLSEIEHHVESLDDYKVYADYLLVSGLLYLNIDEFSASLSSLYKVLEISEKLNDRYNVARALNAIAAVHFRLGDIPRAMENDLRSLSIKRELGDAKLISTSLHQLGIYYSAMNLHSHALEYYTESLAYKHNTTNDISISTTLMGIGVCYEHLGDYPKSLDYHLRSLNIKEQSGNQLLVSTSLSNIAIIYFKMKDYTQAEEYALRSLEIKDRLGITEKSIISLNILSDIYFHTKQIIKLRATAERAYTLSQSLDSKLLLSDAYKKMGNVCELEGDLSKAIEWYNKHYDTYREYQSEDSRRRMEHLSISAEIDKARHETEMAKLKAETLEQELELKQRELTSLALMLSQKNETLSHIQKTLQMSASELTSQKSDNNMSSDGFKRSVVSAQQEITRSLMNDKAWSVFEQQFQLLHRDFMSTLSARFPELSPIELKVCALLKINLNSKEIANILYVEPKSVEVYRFRIRKKLGLSREQNLLTTLATIENNSVGNT